MHVYARACVCVAAGVCVVVTPSTSPLSRIVWTPLPLPCSAPFASAPLHHSSLVVHACIALNTRGARCVEVAIYTLSLSLSLFRFAFVGPPHASLTASLTASALCVFFFLRRRFACACVPGDACAGVRVGVMGGECAADPPLCRPPNDGSSGRRARTHMKDASARID